MGKGPLQISWTMLKKYENCPQHALRSMQRRRATSADVRNFLAGTVADRTMRWWLELPDEERLPGMMVTKAPELFHLYSTSKAEGRLAWKHPKDKENLLNLVLDTVTKLEPMLLHYVTPHNFHPELRTKVRIKIPYLDGNITTIIMAGGIDIAVQVTTPLQLTDPEQTLLSPNDYFLIDLKSTKNMSYLQETAQQSVFYDIMFGHHVGDTSQPKKFAFFFPPAKNQIIWMNITDDMRAQMMGRIIRVAHGMWKREWDPKDDDDGCIVCDTKHTCDKFTRLLNPTTKTATLRQ